MGIEDLLDWHKKVDGAVESEDNIETAEDTGMNLDENLLVESHFDNEIDPEEEFEDEDPVGGPRPWNTGKQIWSPNKPWSTRP